jgi:RNA recognition motif-containing protein
VSTSVSPSVSPSVSTRLYVGNLPAGTTDDDLTELFARYGTVATAGVVVDKNTGRSRGFAIVEMSDGADVAIRATNGSAFQGRTMMVSEATPRPTRPVAPVLPLAARRS